MRILIKKSLSFVEYVNLKRQEKKKMMNKNFKYLQGK